MKKIFILILVLITIVSISTSITITQKYKSVSKSYDSALEQLEYYDSSAYDNSEKTKSEFFRNLSSDQSKLYSSAYDEGYEYGYEDGFSDGYDYATSDINENEIKEKESKNQNYLDSIW